MDHQSVADHFRRMEINGRIERSNEIINHYNDGLEWERERLRRNHVRLGHVAERLAEPEPEED